MEAWCAGMWKQLQLSEQLSGRRQTCYSAHGEFAVVVPDWGQRVSQWIQTCELDPRMSTRKGTTWHLDSILDVRVVRVRRLQRRWLSLMSEFHLVKHIQANAYLPPTLQRLINQRICPVCQARAHFPWRKQKLFRGATSTNRRASCHCCDWSSVLDIEMKHQGGGFILKHPQNCTPGQSKPQWLEQSYTQDSVSSLHEIIWQRLQRRQLSQLWLPELHVLMKHIRADYCVASQLPEIASSCEISQNVLLLQQPVIFGEWRVVEMYKSPRSFFSSKAWRFSVCLWKKYRSSKVCPGYSRF